jgi:hypothetical protein
MIMGGKGPSIMGGPGFRDGPLQMVIEDITRTPEGGLLLEIGRAPGDQ